MWDILLPDTSRVSTTESERVMQALTDRGIILRRLSDQRSLLIINGTVANNQSVVTCIAIDEDQVLSRCSSRNVEVKVFGKNYA